MTADPRALVWQHLHWPTPLDPALAVGLLKRLAADALPGPVIFEAHARLGHVVYLVGTASHQIRALVDLLEAAVPSLAHSAVDRDEETSVFHRLKLSPGQIPLAATQPGEAARSLLGALTAAHFKDEHALVQVVLGRGRRPSLMPPHAFDPSQTWFDVLLHGSRVASSDLAGRMKTKQTELGFAATIRISATASNEARRLTILRGIAAAVRTHRAPGLQIDFLADKKQATMPKRLPLNLSVSEALTLLAWPVSATDLPGLPDPHPKQLRPAHLPTKPDRVFARTTAPGKQLDVGISAIDSLFHTLLLGPTGSGKSTAILNLICADMAAGRSVVVIDPKSDLVRDVLARMPKDRADDVVVLDPTSQTPAGLNPLRSDGTSPELIADSLLCIFTDLFRSNLGPNVADALHASLLTLSHSPGATLASLPTLFTDPRYRAHVMASVPDPASLESFWSDFDAKSPGQQQQFIGPVLSRLRQFLLRPNLRRVLDQPEPRFQLADVMTKPRILLVPLNSGILGSESARLLGSLIVTQLWQLSLARAAQPPTSRTHVSIYIDEVQEYLRLGGSDLADALARSRSLGVAWHLAHQFRDQLDPATRRAIDANARNVVAFNLPQADARELARSAPDLTAEDFMALPKFGIYARLMDDGTSTGWFSAATKPAPMPSSDPANLRAASEARYGLQPDTASTTAAKGSSLAAPGSEPQAVATNGSATTQMPAIGRRKRSQL